MQTSQCLSYRPCWRDGGPGGIQNLLKEEWKELDGTEKKEDGYDKEEMEGKRRNEEKMQRSLVVVKFPLVPFATCLLHLQLLLQGSFHKEEVKQPHFRDTQRPNIMNYLGPPESPDHLPLATLPCLP